MLKPETPPLSSNRPDLHLLGALGVLHRVLVSLVATVSAISLCGWLIPPLSRVLPHFQLMGMMKVNNALTIFLCSLSLILSEPRRTKMAVQLSRLFAGCATLLAAVLVFERFSGITYRIDTLLAADASSPHPGRVAIEACGTRSEDLEQLIKMADMMMYEAKRTKNHLRPEGTLFRTETDGRVSERHAAAVEPATRTHA